MAERSFTCDKFKVNANEITFQAPTFITNQDTIECSEIIATGTGPGVSPLTITGNTKLVGTLEVTGNTNFDAGINVSANIITTNVFFNDNGRITFPTDSGADGYSVNDTRQAIGNNNLLASGPMASSAIFVYSIYKIQNLSYYNLRMYSDIPITFTATSPTITTEVINPSDYLPGILASPNGPNSTVISLQALIDDVIVALQGNILSNGTITITRPGGTFTSGETFYLFEVGGSWITL